MVNSMELKVVLMGVLLLVLLAVSTVQAFQLMQLKEEIAQLEASASPAAGSSVNLQTSLNNLPTMVGGC